MTDNTIQLDSGGSYLFVGNSFTFGRVDPVMSYNSDNVRDLTAPVAGTTFANTSGSNPYEPHPWGGVPGIFEAFASQVGLELDVAISARNAATLQGQYLNSNPAGWDLRGNVASQSWDVVVLQDNSTQALPSGTGSITFAAGSSTATLTIHPTADTKVETDETIGLQVTANSAYRTSAGVVSGTILNDDPTGPVVNPAVPTVTLVASPGAVLEDGTQKLVYTFTRTGSTTAAMTVNFTAFRDGSTAPSVATGGDFENNVNQFTTSFQANTGQQTTGNVSFTSNTGSVVIPAGATSVTFTLDPRPDTAVENDESIRLTLSANANYNVGTQGAVSVTILNDDFAAGTDTSLPNISLSLAASAVYEDGSGDLVYVFTRTGSNTDPLTVNFGVSGTATLPGNDFTVTGANSFSTAGAADPNLQSFNTYAVKLAQYATTGAADGAVPANPHANAATDVYLYETWARPNMVTGAHVANTDDTTGAVTTTATTAPEYYVSFEAMTADLRAAYEGLAAANPIFAGVAPVGAAFLAAVQNGTATRDPYAPDAGTDGKVDLWWDDNLHASKYGSYLSGLTLFGTLTGLDPRSLGAAEHVAADLGITQAEAAALQGVAAATLGFSLDAHWTAPGQVTELQGGVAGLLATAGSFGFSDSDVADTHTVTVTPLTPGSIGTFSATLRTDTTGDGTGGAVNWLFTVDNADVAFVSPGTTRVEHFLVTISDGNGGQAQRDIAVTINGTTNDAPVAVADTAAITAGTSPVTGNVLTNDTDVDAGDTHTVSSVNGVAGNVGTDVVGTYGTLHLNSDGTYTYTVANNQAVQALTAGQQVTDVFSYVNTDNHSGVSGTANLTVTVTGANPAPVITSFSDDIGVKGDNITADTTLQLSGTADAGSRVVIFDGPSQIGIMFADNTGAWSFNTATLAAGFHTFSAVAYDSLNNASLVSTPLVIQVDAGGANHAPTVNPHAFAIIQDEAVQITTVVPAATDVDGDTITRYRFFDDNANLGVADDHPTSDASGYFSVNGVRQASGTAFEVTDLSTVKYTAGTSTQPTGNLVEHLWVQAFDGQTWGAWTMFDATQSIHAMPANHAPVAVTANLTATTKGQTFNIPDFVTVTDPDQGQQVVRYEFWDDNASTSAADDHPATDNTGYFTLNGFREDAGGAFSVEAADVNNLTFHTTSGTDILWVRAFDGQDWTGWTRFDITGTANAVPTVAALDKIVARNATIAANSLFTAHDSDIAPVDSITQVQFRDLTDVSTSGYFVVNGVGKAGTDTITVAAADLASSYFQTGNGSSDNLSVRVFDGYQWSEWSNFHVNNVNQAPVLNTPTQAAMVAQDYTVSVSTLFDLPASATDADGDPIKTYTFWDDNQTVSTADDHPANDTTGYFTVNGVRQAAGTAITVAASDLANVQFVKTTDATVGSEMLWVTASDGTTNSDWKMTKLLESVNAPVASNHAPVALTPDVTVAKHGVSLAATSLFSSTDADSGQPITRVQFWDDHQVAGGADDNPLVDTSGHFVLNGATLSEGTTLDFAVSDLGSLTFESGSGSDLLYVRVFDGQDWSSWSNFHVIAPVDNAPTISGAANSSHAVNAVVSAQSLFTASDVDAGDQIVKYQFWDSSAGASSSHFTVDGAPQPFSTAIDVLATDLSHVSVVANSVPATDGMWVRAFDGTAWSDWHAFSIMSH